MNGHPETTPSPGAAAEMTGAVTIGCGGAAAAAGEGTAEEECTIVIVGGGPQGLAVLSALHEWYSYAELDDSNYRRVCSKTKKFAKVANPPHPPRTGVSPAFPGSWAEK